MAGSPQQNGLAERFNKTLMEIARSMIHGANLPKSLWGEAIQAANYLKNRSPHKGLDEDITPYEAFTGIKPFVGHLRIFGSKVYVHVPRNQRSKLSPRAWVGTFVGYAPEQRGYKVWKNNRTEVVVSRDLIFLERDIMTSSKEGRGNLIKEISTIPVVQEKVVEPEEREVTLILEPKDRRSSDAEINPGEDTAILREGQADNPTSMQETIEEIVPANSHEDQEHDGERDEESESQEPLLRRSGREIRPLTRLSYPRLGIQEALLAYCNIAEMSTPQSMKEALTGVDRNKWKEAMDNEMQSLVENQTWELVDLPDGRKPIGVKWVFKIKENSDGNIRYKARLVAKGYSQKEGIDYSETFAPVMKSQSLRMILAVANQMDLCIHQMDVTTAFLNGRLEEEIFMLQPEGYEKQGEETKVCKLKRSIYGLKQSPRCWNQRIHAYLTKNGFTRSLNDYATYLKGQGKNMVILGIYVDDIIIVSKLESTVKIIKEKLSNEYKMVDFGEIIQF